jgi:hypothetical protein
MTKIPMFFPIDLSGADREAAYAAGCPDAVIWHVFAPHEEQARLNHGGQDLLALARRGGLDPAEAVAVLEDRPWRPMKLVEAVAALRHLCGCKPFEDLRPLAKAMDALVDVDNVDKEMLADEEEK